MRRRLTAALLLAAMTLPAIADVGPVPEPPAPPAGPKVAFVRGLAVGQIYTYWRGRHWFVVVSECAVGGKSCQLADCFVTGVDGHNLEGGDVAALVAADKAAPSKSITLTFDKCGVSSIKLAP